MNGVRSKFVVLLSFVTLLRQAVGVSSINKGNCSFALGVENGRNPDIHLSASSCEVLSINHSKNHLMEAHNGRLNGQYAWCINKAEGNWLMVDLGRITTITGIATQGFRNVYNHYFVETYRVQYSLNGTVWEDILAKNDQVMTFPGNSNGLDTVRNNFDAVQAKSIKFIPVQFNSRVCMRVEIYGCDNDTLMTTPSLPITTPKSNHNVSSSTLPTPTKYVNSPKSLPKLNSLQTTPETSTEYIVENNTILMVQNGSSDLDKVGSTDPNSKSMKSHQESSGLDGYYIAFIVFAVLVAVVVIPVITFLVLRRKKREIKRVGMLLDEFDKIPCIESPENGNIV